MCIINYRYKWYNTIVKLIDTDFTGFNTSISLISMNCGKLKIYCARLRQKKAVQFGGSLM